MGDPREVSKTPLMDEALQARMKMQMDQTAAMVQVMEKVSDKLGGQSGQSNDDSQDHCRAMGRSGVKLNYSWPKFADKDTDFDRHWRRFWHTIEVQTKC